MKDVLPKLTETFKKDNAIIKVLFSNIDFYGNNSEFLYVLENYLKICRECICESVGSVIANHSHNGNIKSDSLMQGLFTSWNGPPINLANSLLHKSLIRRFGGERFHFTRFDSTSKLKIFKT